MATCKECLCYDVCKEHNRLMMTVNFSLVSVYQENVEKSCRHFKGKSQYRKVKNGEWIILGGDVGYVDAQCSECKKTKVFDDFGDGPHLDEYCPFCGAYMKGEENEDL